MITSLLLWFKTKTRLVTEYALLGLLVSVGGLAYSLYLTRAEVREDLSKAHDKINQVKTELVLQQSANQLNKSAIESLVAFRQLDSTAIEGLFSLLQKINTERTAQDQRLQMLEKENAQVTPYLDSDVPVGYDCVLEPGTCVTPTGTNRSN